MHRHWSFIASALVLLDLRVVAQRFDVLAEFHKGSERGDARTLALHDLAHFVLLEPIAPDIVDLLDAQRYTPVFRIDLQNFGGNVFALLENLMRIFHSPSPAYVADVHQPVKSVLDF